MNISAEASLTTAQRGKIRRLVRSSNERAPEGGELNVVPYLDIVLNIVLFVLGGLSIVFVSSIDARAAEIGPNPNAHPIPATALRLTALVTAEGVSLKTSAGNLAPGCGGLGPGLAVATRDGRQNLTEISRCARALKDSSPNFGDETQVTLSADPGVDTQTLVEVIDSLRADERG
jgi:biopolymer transport protein TolR